MYGHTNPTIRTTEDGEQVGPKMHQATRYVANGPTFHEEDVWPSMNQLAQAVGPNGSQDYGYRIVNRCIRKSLITVHPEHSDANPHGRGAVVLTDKGARHLNETEDMNLDPENYVPANAYWSRSDNEWRVRD